VELVEISGIIKDEINEPEKTVREKHEGLLYSCKGILELLPT
jgi:hypothetical protein